MGNPRRHYWLGRTDVSAIAYLRTDHPISVALIDHSAVVL